MSLKSDFTTISPLKNKRHCCKLKLHQNHLRPELSRQTSHRNFYKFGNGSRFAAKGEGGGLCIITVATTVCVLVAHSSQHFTVASNPDDLFVIVLFFNMLH